MLTKIRMFHPYKNDENKERNALRGVSLVVVASRELEHCGDAGDLREPGRNLAVLTGSLHVILRLNSHQRICRHI